MKIELNNNKVYLDNDGVKKEIHPFWLRERVIGEKFVDNKTKQRLFDPTLVDKDIKINDVNLTNNFLISKGVTQYKLIPSLGATETYPFIGSSEIITDITSTGKTLEDNNLRVLKDGQILKSAACLMFAKKKAASLQPFLKSLF